MAEFMMGSWRVKKAARRRGQGSYEYRVLDAKGEIVAVCLTPENCRRVFDALTAPPCEREHVEYRVPSRSDNRFYGDENNG